METGKCPSPEIWNLRKWFDLASISFWIEAQQLVFNYVCRFIRIMLLCDFFSCVSTKHHDCFAFIKIWFSCVFSITCSTAAVPPNGILLIILVLVMGGWQMIIPAKKSWYTSGTYEFLCISSVNWVISAILNKTAQRKHWGVVCSIWGRANPSFTNIATTQILEVSIQTFTLRGTTHLNNTPGKLTCWTQDNGGLDHIP